MASEAEMKFVVIFDAQLRLLKVPERLLSQLGFRRSEEEQLSWQHLVVEDASVFMPEDARKPLLLWGHLQRADGEVLAASFSCERIEMDGDLFCAEISLGDGRSGSEERPSPEFFATASHELRAALNGIVGSANSLGNSQLDEEQGAVLEKKSPTLGDEALPAGELGDTKRDGSKRILVVEDNQLNADILGHFLRDYGAGYNHVDNGRLAVEEYQKGKYDLILMDVMLPEMNGYEATEKILALSETNPPVPIIGVTAKVFRRDHLRCIEAGMVEVVHKPVDFKQLRNVLDRYLYSKSGDTPTASETIQGTLSDAGAKIANGLSDLMNNEVDISVLEAYIERMRTEETNGEQVVGNAIEILDKEIEGLFDALRKQEREAIAMQAHSLKGALALLGARTILDLTKGLELIVSDSRTPFKAEHWRRLLKSAYSDFKTTLEAYLQTADVG